MDFFHVCFQYVLCPELIYIMPTTCFCTIYIYIFCVCVSMFIGVEAWLEGDLNMSRRFTVMLIFRSLDSFGQVLSRKFRFRPIDQLTIDKCLDVCGFNRNPHGSF